MPLSLRLGNTGLLRRPTLPLELLWPNGLGGDCADRAGIAHVLEQPTTQRITASMAKHSREIAMRDTLKDDITRYRTLCRLVTRTVPLGWGVVTQVACAGEAANAPRSDITANTSFSLRIDSTCLLDLFRAARAASISDSAEVWSNPTLYQSPSGFRFYEAIESARSPTQSLSQVEQGVEICAAVELAFEQPRLRIHQLAEMLSAKTGCDNSDALALVHDLIKAGVLCSGPRAPLADLRNTGLDALDEFPEFTTFPAVAEMRAALSRLHSTCGEGTPGDFRRLNESVRLMLQPEARPRAEEPLLVGTASVREPIHIPAIVQSRTQEVLNDLLPHFNRQDLPLSRFISIFESKFGDAQVPLMLSVDPDYGIDLFASVSSDSSRASNDTALVVAWERSVRRSEKTVTLTEADLALGPSPTRLGAFGDGVVQLQILSGLSDRVASEPVAQLEGFRSGPTTRFYSRFLRDHLEYASALSISSIEDSSRDVVHADVLYVAANTLANISASPPATKYVVLCDDVAAPQGCIGLPIGELLVSVADGRLRLFSPSVGKWIEPRMNHPVNSFFTTRPAVAFLAYLERHNCIDYDFRWPALLRNLEHLPRITYKQVVISLARWALRPDVVARITTSHDTSVTRSALEEAGVPRLFSFGPDDKALIYDQSSEISMQAFAAALRRSSAPVLFESLLQTDSVTVAAPLLPFPHQLQIPVVGGTTSGRDQSASDGGPRPSTFYVVRPGGEWATIKLYANESSLDALITGPVAKWIENLTNDSLVDGWFFIRYRDPEPHIRVRLRAPKECLWSKTVPALLSFTNVEPARSRIHKVTIEPYVREVERYGGPTFIDLHERIFCVDSALATRAIRTFGVENAQLLTVAHWLGLLRPTNLTIAAKRDLLRAEARTSMRRDTVRTIAPKWRGVKRQFGELGQLEALQGYVADVAVAYAGHVSSTGGGNWDMLNLPSILHMSANRVAGILPKYIEASLLEVLARHYDELVNRGLKDDF